MVSSSRRATHCLTSLDTLPIGTLYGDKELMKKRFRPNPKFSHVQTKLDIGKKKKEVVPVDCETLLSKRKGENFGRIRTSVLAMFL